MSPVTCHLSPGLPTFQAMLVKTAFILKPHEATLWVQAHKHIHTPTSPESA